MALFMKGRKPASEIQPLSSHKLKDHIPRPPNIQSISPTAYSLSGGSIRIAGDKFFTSIFSLFTEILALWQRGIGGG
jgi:hypothetical protein